MTDEKIAKTKSSDELDAEIATLEAEIYTNPEDLVRDDPGADIKTIKKNNFDWNMPIFGA